MNWDVLDTLQFRVTYAALLIETYVEMVVVAVMHSWWVWMSATLVVLLMGGMIAIMQRSYFLEMRREWDEFREWGD